MKRVFPDSKMPLHIRNLSVFWGVSVGVIGGWIWSGSCVRDGHSQLCDCLVQSSILFFLYPTLFISSFLCLKRTLLELESYVGVLLLLGEEAPLVSSQNVVRPGWCDSGEGVSLGWLFSEKQAGVCIIVGKLLCVLCTINCQSLTHSLSLLAAAALLFLTAALFCPVSSFLIWHFSS